MNYTKAMQALTDGQKVRLPEWTGWWEKIGARTIIAFTRTGDRVPADTKKYASRDDWEIADGSLGFDWAILALKAGKKVRKKNWHAGDYVYLPDGVILFYSKEDNWTSHIKWFADLDIVSTDWELYEP